MSGCVPTDVKCKCICHEGGTLANPMPYTWCCNCKKPKEDDTTLCGFCLERVKVNSLHGCAIIKSVKDKTDSALSDIQKWFKKEIEFIKEKGDELWRNTGDALRAHECQLSHLNNRVDALKNSVDDILKQVRAIDYIIKQSGLCIDNSHIENTAKLLKKRSINLPDIGELNEMAKEKLVHAKYRSLKQKYQDLQNKCGEKSRKLDQALQDMNCAIINERAANEECKRMRERIGHLGRALEEQQDTITNLHNKIKYYEQSARESKL